MMSGFPVIVISVTTPELLSAHEIANRIGVTDRTVRRWIKSGELPAVRSGRAYEINLDDARKLAPSSSSGHRRSSELQTQLAERDRERALLEGRYLELKEHCRAVEQKLAIEQEKRIELEARLRLAQPFAVAS
jgi:excisionase family DNA binding protein